MGFTAVKEHRHVEFRRQCQLCIKRILLLLMRRQVAIKIEPALTDSHHFRFFSQSTQGTGNVRGPFAGMMRMNARGRPAEIGLRFSQPLSLLALQRISAGNKHAGDARITRAFNHLLPVGGELRAGQVYTDIKHNFSHSL